MAPQDVSWWVSSQALAGQLHLSFTVSVVLDIKLITIFIILIDVLFVTSTNLNQHPTQWHPPWLVCGPSSPSHHRHLALVIFLHMATLTDLNDLPTHSLADMRLPWLAHLMFML